VRFFDLMFAVRKHLTFLSVHTGHTERHPHSLVRWFLWLESKETRFANIKGLGDLLVPMCSISTIANHEDEEAVYSHSCNYCTLLRRGMYIPTFGQTRCTELMYFKQTTPFANILFAITAKDCPPKKNNKKLNIITGFGRSNTPDLDIVACTHTTLRFGPVRHVAPY
jgi:hypothetical protein